MFIAPHWPVIYARDAGRKQDPEEAERTCCMMQSVYAEYGYEFAELHWPQSKSVLLSFWRR